MTYKTTIFKMFKSTFSQPKSSFIDDYHLKNIDLNLFFKPHNKIDERANTIFSSAAMIFNTIGPNNIIFDGIRYSHIEYERDFPALNKQDNSDHDHSAHLDVSMLSDDGKELVLIESKCTEWLFNPKTMTVSYLSSHCYLPETGFYTQHFIESFRNLKKFPERRDPEDNSRLIPFYKRYDAVQMNIHILGIYNYCARKEKELPKKIRLLNVVWDYEEACSSLISQSQDHPHKSFQEYT